MKAKVLITTLVLLSFIWAFDLEAQMYGWGRGRGMGQGLWNCPPWINLNEKLAEKSLSYQLGARKILTPDQITQLPPGCSLGFGNPFVGPGFGMSPGYGYGRGPGYGRGRGYGSGRGRCW
jgi:hypothetical protein